MELKQELKELVSEIIEIDDFKEDDNFVEDLGVDSMMALEIVVRIEKNTRYLYQKKNYLIYKV